MKLSGAYYLIPSGIRKFFQLTYHDVINSELSLARAQTMLDVGCGEGNSIERIEKKARLVGIDAWKKYLDKARKKPYDKLVCGDITRMKFKGKSFDAVMMISVLEHLKKKDGIKVIGDMEKIARKVVIILTPAKFLEQEEFDDNPYQRHLSGFWNNELKKRGYEVIGMTGLDLGPKWLSRNPILSTLTQPMARMMPEHANEIMAVKRLWQNRNFQ